MLVIRRHRQPLVPSVVREAFYSSFLWERLAASKIGAASPSHKSMGMGQRSVRAAFQPRQEDTVGTSKPNIPIKGSNRLRTGRRSIPGQVYLLTTATFKRRPIFQNGEAAQIVLNSLKYLERQGRILLEAAVVMPDHAHVVAGLLSGTLGEFVQSWKGFTARAINKHLSRKGPVWNSQFHDHAVRKDEVLVEVIRYCLNNPVRAGLVEDFHDYLHWYCRYRV